MYKIHTVQAVPLQKGLNLTEYTKGLVHEIYNSVNRYGFKFNGLSYWVCIISGTYKNLAPYHIYIAFVDNNLKDII